MRQFLFSPTTHTADNSKTSGLCRTTSGGVIMFLRCSFAAMRRLALTFLSILAPALLLLSAGCDRESDGRMDASAQYFSDAGRPAEISQAYTELQSGQAAQAYATAQAYIETHPGGAYRSEAFYIAGQSLAAQGKFEAGKEKLEIAIDKTRDRNLKALAMLGRADCNMGLEKYPLASRQYHWIELNYKDIKPLHQDELMFKLGLAAKKAGN